MLWLVWQLFKDKIDSPRPPLPLMRSVFTDFFVSFPLIIVRFMTGTANFFFSFFHPIPMPKAFFHFRASNIYLAVALLPFVQAVPDNALKSTWWWSLASSSKPLARIAVPRPAHFCAAVPDPLRRGKGRRWIVHS